MENDVGDDMYIAIKGSFGVYVNSFTGFPTKVAVIGDGACFGEMSVIDGWPRSATVVAEEDSIALTIKKENFPQFIESCPDLAFGMLKTLSSRAQATLERVREVGVTSPDLSDELRTPKQIDKKTDMANMVLLSQRIRELNEIMGVGKQAAIEIKADGALLTLLPSNHPQLNIPDKFDNSKLLSNKKYICPYCYHRFSGKVPIVSRLQQQDVTLDQRVIYANFNILLYNNIVCPNCNYCDTYQEFTKMPDDGSISDIKGNRFKNFENFAGYKDEINHTIREAVLSHYLQLECLKQVKNSELRSAQVLHRLFWLYKDCDEIEFMKKAAVKARFFYEKYLELNGGKIPVADELTVNVIIAELCTALGEKDEAIAFYTKNSKLGGVTNHELVRKSLQMISKLKSM